MKACSGPAGVRGRMAAVLFIHREDIEQYALCIT
jgi:hypothetical protein